MNSLDPLSVSHIESGSNPRIKDLVRLRDRAHRDRAGLLLIEGYREVLRAVNAGVSIKELFFCEKFFLGENEPALIRLAGTNGASLFSVAETPFRKISYRDRPDGLIAISGPVTGSLSSLVLSPSPLLVVAEAIEKPGNLGAILRSADAAGVDGVIVCDGSTDINNPNVVRASTGTLFTVPVVEATTVETLAWLRERKVRIIAATPHATACYSDFDFRTPCAIAVGAEQYGLGKELMEQADERLRIPMAGVADSLNVSTAATLLLFEAARQRGFPRKS
ncbi:MAG: RNA methyltransferase [bacterium]